MPYKNIAAFVASKLQFDAFARVIQIANGKSSIVIGTYATHLVRKISRRRIGNYSRCLPRLPQPERPRPAILV